MATDLSLIIPTYNERETIEGILCATVRALGNRSFEVIVVDDDSPDRTWEIVEHLSAMTPVIRLLHRTGSRRDQAHAVMEGFRISRGAILGKMDADGSHEPRALPQLIEAIENGFEVAIGSRYSPGGTISSWPRHRRILSKVSTIVVRLLLGLEIKDPLSGFWMVRREVYDRTATFPTSDGFKLLLQLCVRGRAQRIAEVPIDFHDRMGGKTKLRAAVIFQSLAMTVSMAVANLYHSSRAKRRDG